jgi:hypothetical protein
MFPISRDIITAWAGEKMSKDELLKEMDKTAEEAKKVLDSYDFMAKSLYTFYDDLINRGFDEGKSFMLTQQYFDRMLRKFM